MSAAREAAARAARWWSLPFRLCPCAPSGSRLVPDPWVAAVRAERDRREDRRACHEEQRTDWGTASSHRSWRLGADAIPGRGEEPIGAVDVRERAPGPDAVELGVRAIERGSYLFVLRAVQGASPVDEALRREWRGGLQQLQLQGGKGGEQARIDPPARVGSPAQRPQLGAGGVHEHAIGVPRSAGDLDQMACVRAPGTRPQPVEAPQVDVVRDDAGPLRGEQKRLSPGPRAQGEHGFARLRLHQMAQELAALVLRLEQTFAPRAGAEEVRTRRPDEQGVGSARRWRGLDPFVEKVRRELLAGAEQTIGAQAAGAGRGNRRAE